MLSEPVDERAVLAAARCRRALAAPCAAHAAHQLWSGSGAETFGQRTGAGAAIAHAVRDGREVARAPQLLESRRAPRPRDALQHTLVRALPPLPATILIKGSCYTAAGCWLRTMQNSPPSTRSHAASEMFAQLRISQL